MSEIKITNTNNRHKFVSFRIDGLEDGITVGVVYPNRPDNWEQALSIAYKGDVKIIPFNATSKDIKQINEINDSSDITVPLHIKKETYDWLTTPSEEVDDNEDEIWTPSHVTELSDEAFDEFEKEVMNPEPDKEKVEAARKIFEGVDKIPVDTSDIWKHELTYGQPHMLELMDEWGIDGTNYADFRSVIQEHCFDKGLYCFDDIEKTWKEHVEGLKKAAKSLTDK